MAKLKLKPKTKKSLKGIKKVKTLKPSVQSHEIRERTGIDVLKPEEEKDFYPGLVIPSCTHGKCLLFKQADSRWFGCALHRSPALCSFKCEWPKKTKIEPKMKELKLKTSDRDYLPDKIKEFLSVSPQKFYFCKKCVDVFQTEAHCHPVQGPFKDESDLLQFLPALQNDASQAQYWFASDALKLLYDSTQSTGIEEYICIGTPQFFKYAKDKGKKAFLLDIDNRFKAFFHNTEFAQYNMMNNEFLNESKQFQKFLKSSKKPVIVCDSPFGVIIKALIWSLKDVAEKCPVQMHYVIALPYFLDKHLYRIMPEIKMLEYMVPYQNHPTFKNAKKSPVRFFTTLDRSKFILPPPLYKNCKECNRYVTAENRHCSVCKNCPSRDGLAMKHCGYCNRCVPQKYGHCKKCNICSFKNRCHSKESKEEEK